MTGPPQGWGELKLLTVVILEPLVAHGGMFCSAFLQPLGRRVIFLDKYHGFVPCGCQKSCEL